MATPDTKLALLRAAEKLFAERGVEQVSLIEIGEAAQQRNRSAVQYHFGNKRELIECLLERHSGPIQERWQTIFPRMEADGVDLRKLVTLLVTDLAGKLDDPDGGAEYIEICAQLVASRAYPLMKMRASWAPGAITLGKLMMQVTSNVPDALLVQRMQRVASVLYQSCANFRRSGGLSREIFEADLVDSLSGLIAAPVSARTQALLG